MRPRYFNEVPQAPEYFSDEDSGSYEEEENELLAGNTLPPLVLKPDPLLQQFVVEPKGRLAGVYATPADSISDTRDRFSSLPADTIREIASKMSVGDIVRTCRVSKRFNEEICTNENFWRYMVRRYYPAEEDKIGMIRTAEPEDMTAHNDNPLRAIIAPVIPDGADPLPTYSVRTTKSIQRPFAPRANLIEGKMVHVNPGAPKFKFSNWKAYYIYLSDNEEKARKRRQIESARAIFRNPVFRNYDQARQEYIIENMIAMGLGREDAMQLSFQEGLKAFKPQPQLQLYPQPVEQPNPLAILFGL